MDQLIDNQEAWALWYNDNADPSVDEIDGDPVTKNWGIRECIIVLIFLLLFFIIFRKKDGEDNESNEADGSSSQRAETTVSSVDKKKLEEEKREMILNLFRSQQNQQVRVDRQFQIVSIISFLSDATHFLNSTFFPSLPC